MDSSQEVSIGQVKSTARMVSDPLHAWVLSPGGKCLQDLPRQCDLQIALWLFPPLS